MLETYQYYPENIQENAGKASQLAAKIRDVIQTSGTVKRYKINVQCYLGEKKIKELLLLQKDGGIRIWIIMLLIFIKDQIFTIV